MLARLAELGPAQFAMSPPVFDDLVDARSKVARTGRVPEFAREDATTSFDAWLYNYL